MLLTKYEHACFTLEKDNKVLVVDPGGWTTDLGPLENVAAIVITHEHADHFDPSAIDAIISRSPNAIIYAHQAITSQLDDRFMTTSVAAGDVVTAAPFTLAFFGGDHAVIHKSFEPVANLGVMINDTVYYPGDSFTAPGTPVPVLALPTVAPWMKISEAMDFVSEVKPQLVFPTHDVIASTQGKHLADRMIPPFVEAYGGTYERLSGPLEIDD